LDALRQNDFEAYKELLRQTHGPQTDDDRFKGESCSELRTGRPSTPGIDIACFDPSPSWMLIAM